MLRKMHCWRQVESGSGTVQYFTATPAHVSLAVSRSLRLESVRLCIVRDIVWMEKQQMFLNRLVCVCDSLLQYVTPISAPSSSLTTLQPANGLIHLEKAAFY